MLYLITFFPSLFFSVGVFERVSRVQSWNGALRWGGSRMGSGPGRPILPVLHASADALVAGRGHVLHGELPKAPGHKGHGAELTPGARTVGILPVKPVLRAAI